MDNWFYLDRQSFLLTLDNELGPTFSSILKSYGFDTAVSFFIGETSDEIISKIQNTFTRYRCKKQICSNNCVTCLLTPPQYAKLTWFTQRLLVMSPHSQSFTKKIHFSTNNNQIQSVSWKIYDFGLMILLFILVFLMFFSDF